MVRAGCAAVAVAGMAACGSASSKRAGPPAQRADPGAFRCVRAWNGSDNASARGALAAAARSGANNTGLMSARADKPQQGFQCALVVPSTNNGQNVAFTSSGSGPWEMSQPPSPSDTTDNPPLSQLVGQAGDGPNVSISSDGKLALSYPYS